MKKFAKITLALLLIVLSAATAFACSSSSSKGIDGIAIDEANMPQVVFVQGNELDLSKGKLNVTGKQPQQIALTDGEVKVSGYDKNTLGKQTLTVEYKGKTTTLDVTVVPRMTVKEAITEYFVDESFNGGEGHLEIYNDDGASFAVPLDDSSVAVTGFDSAAATEELALSVKFTRDGREYDTSYTVKVLELSAEYITLTRPRKTAYKSHETELNMTGASLTLTTPSGRITYVEPSDFTSVTGFEPERVTAENTDAKPLEETITVTYKGFTQTFKITLTYSNVSVFADTVKPLEGLDWSNKIPAVTPAQGKAALDAMDLYLNVLTTDETAYVRDADYKNAVRTATVYGYELYQTEMEKFAELFVADSHGDAELTAADRAATKELLGKIDDGTLSTDTLWELCNLLDGIAELHGDVTLVGTQTTGAYLSRVLDASGIDWVIARADALIAISEILDAVPADWTADGLGEYATVINNAREKLVQLAGEEPDVFERYTYNILSSWREKDDVFDILFTYYYNMAMNTDEAVSEQGREAVESLIDIRLPGELEPYYTDFLIAYMQAANQEFDTAPFMAYFFDVLESEQAILNSDNEMIVNLYQIYGFAERTQALKSVYYAYSGAQLDTPEFVGMWDMFFDVVYTDSEDPTYAGKVESMFERLLNLTPAQIAGFLASNNAEGTAALFPDDNPFATSFTATVLSNYMDVLPEDMILTGNEYGIVLDIFDAVDFFMFRNEPLEGMEGYPFLTGFLRAVQEVNRKYNAFDPDDKSVFDAHIGFALDKLNEWAALYNEDGTLKEIALTEDEQAQLTALQSAFADYTIASVFSVMQNASLAAISAGDRVMAIADEITANGSDALKRAYRFAVQGEFCEAYHMTPEQLYGQVRAAYIGFLTAYPSLDGEGTYDFWTAYGEYDDLRAFVLDAFDFLMAQFDFGALSEIMGDEIELPTYTFTADDVARLMQAYAALSDEERYMFYLMDDEGAGAFAIGMKNFFAETYKDNAAFAALAREMLAFDARYLAADPSDEKEAAKVIADWEAIEADIAALSTENRALFDTYFSGLYDLYHARLTAQEQPREPQLEQPAA